jgi:hypothetical protein
MFVITMVKSDITDNIKYEYILQGFKTVAGYAKTKQRMCKNAN